MKIAFILLFSFFLNTVKATKKPETSAQEKFFIEKYSLKYGITKDDLKKLLEEANFEHGIKSSKKWTTYRDQFLNKDRIFRGVKFYKKYKKIFSEAQKKFGVSPEVILGIMGEESEYMSYMGNVPIIDALSTIGFNKVHRYPYFLDELASYLLICYERGWSPRSKKGSFDGGMGGAQFMPSNYLNYAVSYDGKSKPDLYEPKDCIFSVANFLKHFGWKDDNNFALKVKLSPKTCIDSSICNRHDVKKTLSFWKDNGVEGIPDGLDLGMEASIATFNVDDLTEGWIMFANSDAVKAYNPTDHYIIAAYLLGKAVIEHSQK